MHCIAQLFVKQRESIKEKCNVDDAPVTKSLVYGTWLSAPGNMYYLLTKLHFVSRNFLRRQPLCNLIANPMWMVLLKKMQALTDEDPCGILQTLQIPLRFFLRN